jgi:hypothetical protein
MYNLPEQDREQLMMRAAECLDEGSSIEDKMRTAQYMYDSWSDQLRREPDIHHLVEKLEMCLENSRAAMLELGIVEICKHCDEEEGGSCCGAGMEHKFDTLLLLMNLLLGVSLPEGHCRPNSCYLLTEKGCSLKVRLVLCVDFLCPKILNTMSREDLIRLQQISGDELTTGFMLYDALKRFMRNTGHQQASEKVCETAPNVIPDETKSRSVVRQAHGPEQGRRTHHHERSRRGIH